MNKTATMECASQEWLSNGGQMGKLIREFDWSKTSIGPRDSWSPTLKIMTNCLLSNSFPLLLWWGPEFCQIYNDAYSPILGTKHPYAALGRPFKECWSEVWHILGPLAQTPYDGGPPTWMEDILCEINRYGFVEETHFTIAYSPVPDDTVPSGIGGVLATVHEITPKVIAERRVTLLRDLGVRSVEGKTSQEACTIAAEVLANHPKDIPFAMIYLIDQDGKKAKLAAAAGIEKGMEMSPLEVDFQYPEHDFWSLIKTQETVEFQSFSELGKKFNNIPAGPWSNPPNSAVAVALRSNIASRPVGFLIAGISPRLRFDDQYHSFIELLSSQISNAISNARGYEQERKRAEALAEIDRVKTTFFSNVSHEFRTPLTLILGPAQELMSQLSDSRQKENVKIICRNTLRLQKLVNTLLDFSRVEAGRTDVSYEPTALASYTMELSSAFRSTIEQAGLKFKVDCEALSEPAYIDRDMWEKIVFNLISNAFKFTFRGTIHVKLQQVKNCIHFSIKDTGIGISPEELPKVFERFHRVQGAKGRTHEGSGIGLALVQELVKLHGGEISAISIPDQGTEFRVVIPLGYAHLPVDRVRGRKQLITTVLGATPFIEEALRWLPSQEPSKFSQSSSNRQFSSARILLADDNSDMREYLLRLISPYYDVETVINGADAWNLIQKKNFDLILTDIMMPSIDGFSLLKQIRNTPRMANVPVILLSARAGEEACVEGLRAGADDYLVKPFSAKELLARIDSRLKRSPSR